MRGHFVLSPQAQTDLEDIWDYTADRWGLGQAETYIRQLWKHITAKPRRSTISKKNPLASA
jgi:plasmid stabilization system protein ParE